MNIEQQYIDLVKNILENGIEKQPTRMENGKTVKAENGTIGLPHTMIQHDMSKGFPLMTHRKIPWKSVRVELEGFLKGITSKKWFQDRDCHYWDSWSNRKCKEYKDYLEEGKTEKEALKLTDDLGEIYGFLWRCFPAERELIQVSPKKSKFSLNGCYLNEYNKVSPKWDIPKDNEFFGVVFASKSGNFYVKKINTKGKGKYLIEFIDTGYTKIVQKSQIINKNIKDPNGKYIHGIATSNRVSPKNDFEKTLYKNWYDMINRCYNKKCNRYKEYGLAGVRVCDRWLQYKNYRKDIEKINGWQKKLRDVSGYILDKDYFQSGVYAPDTCVFLKSSDNKMYNSMKPVRISKNNESYIFPNYTKASKIVGCNRRAIPQAISQNRKCKGWTCVDLNETWRYKLPCDQLKEICEKLRYNPYDRRVVCTAWNPTNFDKISLNSCHVMWNVVVYGDKLNLCWFQRSCDFPLGIPSNIASYATLMLLLCKHTEGYTNLKPGILTGYLGDCHIYHNQIEGAKEILKRELKPLPHLELTHSGDLFDWTHKDVKLTGYNPGEKISFGDITV